jgi:hypothetical protein
MTSVLQTVVRAAENPVPSAAWSIGRGHLLTTRNVTPDAQHADCRGPSPRVSTSNREGLAEREPVAARHPGDALRDSLAPFSIEADTFERSAQGHDREAELFDRLAAEAFGYLYLGFLHAAEVHRAAARHDRASAVAQGRRHQQS